MTEVWLTQEAHDRLQHELQVEGKLQFPDHHDRRIVAAQRHQIAAADLALDREAEVLEEAFDGQIKRGFQGGLLRRMAATHSRRL